MHSKRPLLSCRTGIEASKGETYCECRSDIFFENLPVLFESELGGFHLGGLGSHSIPKCWRVVCIDQSTTEIGTSPIVSERSREAGLAPHFFNRDLLTRQGMTIRELPLDTLTHEHAFLEPDPSVGFNVYHAKKPFVLVQAAGYLKHVRAESDNKSVYFRGQSRLYPALSPKLYRGIIKPNARGKRDDAMQLFLKGIRRNKKVLRAVSDHVQEPILQHYGLKTRWLDVIDNVWIALWFACHTAHAFGKHGEYLHFEKRIVRHTEPDSCYAYVLLLEAAATPDTKIGPGCFKDRDSATIDLRIAAPSHFVRPHAQHGLVVKALDHEGRAPIDFSPLVAGIIRVDLADALEWLGSGDLLNVHSLFPPPPYDPGYQEILNNITAPDNLLGAIHHIGAGR